MLAQRGDSIPPANTSMSSLVSLLNDKSELLSVASFLSSSSLRILNCWSDYQKLLLHLIDLVIVFRLA